MRELVGEEGKEVLEDLIEVEILDLGEEGWGGDKIIFLI